MAYVQVVLATALIVSRYQATSAKFIHFKSEKLMKAELDRQEFAGLRVKPGSMVVDNKTKTYGYQLSFYSSTKEAFVYLGIFIVYAYFQQLAYTLRENSIKNKLKVLMVKNFELEVDDEDKKAQAVGVQHLQRSGMESELIA